ncbi:hypothetical protein [Microbispora bryophytorum]|uniref:DUF320 domain-containing protein n=1 Tax=Microbispora bryophytorum subsp. camponoti TaxID=1677852 RepID=A0ABR8L584_9ACTN|nr:hypothetical protein [Microbispora camponoti]MBD3144889.1 hypothetical protein [Microbispora camponoti]
MRRLAVTVLVIGLWGSVVPEAEAAAIPGAFRVARHGSGHGDGHGNGHGGGATQVTGGTNTSNSPTIKSPPKQISAGRRNVNAPAANSAVTFAGVQQVSSVSVFTNTLNGNCKRGINRCVINQNLRTVESRGGRR